MPEFSEATQFAVVALSSIFFLVDPFAVIPAFLAMTAHDDRRHRRRMARRASWTCFAVLCAFALAGRFIFKLFGLTLPAFEIAGGLILILVGMEMLQAKRSTSKQTPRETAEGIEKDDIGITPLGVPMLAGPGAISTVMVMMGPQFIWWKAVAVFFAILFTAFASYLVLAAADSVRKYMGETGIQVLVRIFGLLLVAIAVQFIINGLVHLKVLRL